MSVDVDIDSRKYVPVNSNGFTGKKPFAQVETVSAMRRSVLKWKMFTGMNNLD